MSSTLQKETKMKKLILVSMVFILAACSALQSEPTPAPTTPPLAERQIWDNSNVNHYRFQLHLSCFCVFRDQMPLTVEVKDGKVVSITQADGKIVPADDPNYEFFVSYGTFEAMFTRIEGALADPEAGEVTVTYDPTFGFPVDAAIDYIELAADDEMYFTVSGFEQLP
jgi:hypothetical protein